MKSVSLNFLVDSSRIRGATCPFWTHHSLAYIHWKSGFLTPTQILGTLTNLCDALVKQVLLIVSQKSIRKHIKS